jgi:hypothetical protein
MWSAGLKVENLWVDNKCFESTSSSLWLSPSTLSLGSTLEGASVLRVAVRMRVDIAALPA